MRAGPLNRRCSVQHQGRIPDGSGGFTQGWVELRKVWADIALPTGRTSVVAQQVTALVTAEIQVRPAPDLVVGLRMVYKTDRYLVEAALMDGKNDMLRLLCSLVPAQVP